MVKCLSSTYKAVSSIPGTHHLSPKRKPPNNEKLSPVTWTQILPSWASGHLIQHCGGWLQVAL